MIKFLNLESYNFIMIVGISGSVGSGKTSLAKQLGISLGYEVVHLNDLAKNYNLENLEELQTFDFDLDKLLEDLEQELLVWIKEDRNVILEGHFAHFISPDIVDKLIVVSRELGSLKEEYSKRGYNEQKVKDNLEVESFNLCFYEAIEEGYGDEGGELGDLMSNDDKDKGKVKLFENNNSFEELVSDCEKFVLEK